MMSDLKSEPIDFDGAEHQAKLAELYREEQRAGHFHPRADPDTLAYAVVRVTEGFIYNDAIAAVEPAVEQAAAIVALLLV